MNVRQKSNQEERCYLANRILKQPGFVEKKLKLYENVLFDNIKFEQNECDQAGIEVLSGEILNLVVCRENSVKLCVMFESDKKREINKPSLQGVPVLILNPLENNDDDYEQLLSYVDSISASESIERYSLSTVPLKSSEDENKFYNSLIQEHFIERQAPRDLITRDGQDLTTPYGKECGLLTECRIDENGFIYSEVVAARKINTELKVINYLRNRKSIKSDRRIPFEKRIKNIKMGLSGDNHYAESLVKKAANLPIEVFFKEQPNRLNDLKQLIAEFDNELRFDTYMEAAHIIGSLLMDENQKKGIQAMMILASPLLEEIDKQKGA